MAAGDGSTSGASVLGHTVNLIDGTPRALSEYEGKVVLIVNVASQCGLTPQYEGLQKLYEGRREKGLVVLGFPANDFKGQEPGSNSEIAAFCSEKYGVSFPMFEKIAVLGDGRHPLFKQLSDLAPPAGGAPSWNFTKYLVDRKGNAVQRFDPRTSPEDPALVARIDALLAEKP
ncbi:MAG TPA: glutathione peroxidase [Phycisphaerales bacterium]|nr:glutathione peroxidase [Phycisphaerales bacterium]